MSQSQKEQWILVVDDDANFRGLLAQIFNSYGFTVFEARSAKEASDSFRLQLPLLAIVDYRMPDMDGVSWIASIRESGIEIPVVFLSGSFCDPYTFNRLRNVYKVSLILQKPIVPELFMEQIGTLLPHREQLPPQEYSEYGESTQAPFANLANVRLPSAQEAAMNEARREFALELPGMIQMLAQAIRHARDAGNDRRLLAEASNEAHKIKGSAGSYGYTRIGECAGRIERSLEALEPDEGTMSEILWSEIIRYLADAEAAATDLVDVSDADQVGLAAAPSAAILVVTIHDDVIDAALRLPEGIEIVAAVTLEEANSMLVSYDYSAIILDQGVSDPHSVFDFVMHRRLEGKTIPTWLVANSDVSQLPPELVYAGVEHIIPRPIELSALTSVVQDFLSKQTVVQPRVLSVDDDPLLSNLIKKVLTADGMIVETLNEPIKVMERLHEFRPDVVLLDVIMPGLSGYDVCRMLRATSEWNHLRIMFVTSKSDEQGYASAYMAGGDALLPKPIVSAELVRLVREQFKQVGSFASSDVDAESGILLGDAFEQVFVKMIVSADQDLQGLSVGIVELEFKDIGGESVSAEHQSEIFAVLEQFLVKRFRKQDTKGRLANHLVVLAEGLSAEVLTGGLQLLKAEFEQFCEENSEAGILPFALKFGVASMPTDTIDGVVLLDIALGRCSL